MSLKDKITELLDKADEKQLKQLYTFIASYMKTQEAMKHD